MEMEHINENTIRVLLKPEDLSARGFNFFNLLTDRQEIEDFFYSVLEEVDVEGEFRGSEAVTFQVLPKDGGLELYISKNIGDEEGNPFDFLAQHLDEHRFSEFDEDLMDEEELKLEELLEEIESVNSIQEPKEEVKPESKKITKKIKELPRAYVFELLNFEAVIYLASALSLPEVKNNLYLINDHYFLSVAFSKEELESEIKNKVALISEFARLSPVTEDVLLEHGKIIMSEDALETTKHYFLA